MNVLNAVKSTIMWSQHSAWKNWEKKKLKKWIFKKKKKRKETDTNKGPTEESFHFALHYLLCLMLSWTCIFGRLAKTTKETLNLHGTEMWRTQILWLANGKHGKINVLLQTAVSTQFTICNVMVVNSSIHFTTFTHCYMWNKWLYLKYCTASFHNRPLPGQPMWYPQTHLTIML